MRPFSLLCALLVLFTWPAFAKDNDPGTQTREQARWRAERISQVAYRLHFDLYGQSDRFSGQARIRFHLKEALTKPLPLDFAGGSISRLRVNGAAATIHHDGHRLFLPAGKLRPGENEIIIDFSHAYSNNGSGLYRFRDPEDGNLYLYTHFEPFDAHRAFPCFDQPDLKASFALTVKAPRDWQIISSTRESRIEDGDGYRLWHFPASARFSTYLFSLHAGPWQAWEDPRARIPSRLFARRSLAKHVAVEEWFDATRFGLRFFQAYFGHPYPYGKYDQVIVPDFNAGAMENVAAVTFSEHHVQRAPSTYLERQKRISTILHEMAHMWFGNLVTMKWWNGLWLNESFATYMATRAMADYPPTRDQAWMLFQQGMKRWAYQTDQRITTHPVETPVADTGMAFSNFDGISYGKGAAVLKQLVFRLGEDRFRQGLDLYFQHHANGNTETGDFFAALGQAAGRSLDDWVDQWILEPGLNRVQAGFHCRNGRILNFHLEQQAPDFAPRLREHHTRLGLFRNDGKGLALHQDLRLRYSDARTPVKEVVGQPCPDFVYPNLDDQDYAMVTLDSRSLQTLLREKARVPDPFLRAMLWSDLWEMVRDARLSAADFIPLVLDSLPDEKNAQLFQSRLMALQGKYSHSPSLLYYLDLAGQGRRWRLETEKRYWRLLQRRDLDGDIRRALLEGYARIALSDQALDRLQALLRGQLAVAGLKLDQDLRWKLLFGLARERGEAVRPLLDEERKRDPSDRGLKQAIACEAAMPGKAHKQVLFRQLVAADNPTPFAEQRQIIWNLFPLGQVRLRQAIADDFYRALPRLAQTRHEAFLHSFVSSLTPLYCDKRASDRLRAWLDKQADTLAPATGKELRIVLQDDLRCQRILASASPDAPGKAAATPPPAPSPASPLPR